MHPNFTFENKKGKISNFAKKALITIILTPISPPNQAEAAICETDFREVFRAIECNLK